MNDFGVLFTLYPILYSESSGGSLGRQFAKGTSDNYRPGIYFILATGRILCL